MTNSATQLRTAVSASKGLIFAALAWTLGMASAPALANGIQMLPPVTEATKTQASPTPCPPGGSPNILTWDGTNPISCATGVTVTGGGVGIGTTSPQGLLHVEGNTIGGILQIVGNSNAGNLAYAELELSNDIAQRAGIVQISSSQNSIFPNKMEVGTIVNGPLELHTNNIVRMIIDTSGNVGIGTTSPQTPLDVAGPIRATDNSTACTTQNGGALRYNTSTNVFEGCSLTAQGWGWGQLGQDNRQWYVMYSPDLAHPIYQPGTTITNTHAWSIEESFDAGCAVVIYMNSNILKIVANATVPGLLTPVGFTVPPGASFSYSSASEQCAEYWEELR